MRKTDVLVLAVFMGVTHFLWGQQLNVMSYNIRYDNPAEGPNNWNNRKDRIVAQINTYSPTIFGVQEGLKPQLDYLEKQLEAYTYFGVGRDDGKAAGEYTAIFYDSTKVKQLDKGTFWLSPTPLKPSMGWDAAIKRICTYGLFEDLASEDRFFVFNTHFDHKGDRARWESAQLIVSKIKEINPNQLPVVLMGDFNLEPASRGIQLILETFSDTHIAAGDNATGPQGTYNGFNTQKPVTRRIDYIFFDATQFQVVKSAIVSEVKNGRYPSDHFPVYAELLPR